MLAELGAIPQRLRITLVFHRAETRPHRYGSHGLRFDVEGPTESLGGFRERLSKKALEEEEDEDEAKPATGGDSSE